MCRIVGESIPIGSPETPIDVVLVEGILVFYDNAYRQMFDMKVFVDTDADIRLARRVKRDMLERNRTLEHILHQYEQFVKPCYEEFCLPTKKYADVIIPRGADNVGKCAHPSPQCCSRH